MSRDELTAPQPTVKKPSDTFTVGRGTYEMRWMSGRWSDCVVIT
jgi:hypothetical protein